MSDEPKLLDCPFCGGEVDILTSGQIAWTRCPLCKAEGPISQQGKDGAIVAWNRRVPAPAVPDDVAHILADCRHAVDALEGVGAFLTCQGILRQAATTIEALAASVDRANAANEALCADVEAQAAERDALRAQLTEAWTAGRDAAAAEIDCEGCGGKCYDPANCWQSAAYQIRSLTPPEYNSTTPDETAV